jgi:hypothetical protein
MNDVLNSSDTTATARIPLQPRLSDAGNLTKYATDVIVQTI